MKTPTPKKIFIVDDEPLMTELLKDYLSREVEHDIHCFFTGEESRTHMDECPDVIILDHYLNMKDKNAATGLDLLPHIRKSCPSAHVIMLSAQERYSVAAQSIQKGAERYIFKNDPKAFEEIAGIIDEINL